jgi:hypothetical protein
LLSLKVDRVLDQTASKPVLVLVDRGDKCGPLVLRPHRLLLLALKGRNELGNLILGGLTPTPFLNESGFWNDLFAFSRRRRGSRRGGGVCGCSGSGGGRLVFALWREAARVIAGLCGEIGVGGEGR